MKNKSLFGILVTILTASFLLAACGGNDNSKATSASDADAGKQEQATDPIKLKIADISSNPVFRVAKNKGFFEKYGIEAEIITFATPAEGINSLFIKQADIGFGADFPSLNAVSKGEFSIIAATGTDTELSAAQWKLFVQDDIKSAADLKGKKLSTLRGTFLPYLWDVYLKDNGVALSDTEQIGQGGFDEAYIALKKGEIDATWVIGATLIDKFKAIDGVHELTDMSQTSVRIGANLIAPNSLIKEHPQGIANLLLALDEATTFIAANPDETADILFKETKQPKDATLRDLKTNNWTIGFSQQSFDSLTNQKNYMVGAGIIEKDFNLADKLSLDGGKQSLPERFTYQK